MPKLGARDQVEGSAVIARQCRSAVLPLPQTLHPVAVMTSHQYPFRGLNSDFAPSLHDRTGAEANRQRPYPTGQNADIRCVKQVPEVFRQPVESASRREFRVMLPPRIGRQPLHCLHRGSFPLLRGG